MHQIDLNEAKRHLVDIIDVALGGEEVVITQDDRPVLKLIRVVSTQSAPQSRECQRANYYGERL